MTSVRQTLAASWMPRASVIRRDMAPLLQLGSPLSLRQLMTRLERPEVLSFDQPIVVDGPIGGQARLILRSDGTYHFSGHMRATGGLSFSFKVQAEVRAGTSLMVALEANGRVFGSDTPGDRQRDWNEDGRSEAISSNWGLLRSDPRLDIHVEKNSAGVLAVLVDVAETVLAVYVAAQLAGEIAAIIVLGAELGATTGQTFANPNILAGVTVAGGILVVFGPSAIIPAIVAGAVVAAVADIRFRKMEEAEIALAERVFKGTLPIDRIVITDLSNPGENNIAREFCIPGLDGSILVNMGRNFDATLSPDVQGREAYAKPGQVLIHELTHAWQIAHQSFMPGFMCRGMFGDKNYQPSAQRIADREPWSSGFGLEQQATIVDAWFGTFNGLTPDAGVGLDSASALQDPRFHYISENIRRGRT